MSSDARALAEATSSASDATSSGRDDGATLGRVAAAVGAACALGAAAYVAYRASRRRGHNADPGADGQPPKVVYLIRHGQSTFNAAYERDGVDPMLFDAPLTKLGRRQVAQLNRTVVASARGYLSSESSDENHDDGTRRASAPSSSQTLLRPAPEVVLVSPLTRALQTAVGAFDGVDVPVEVLPEMREHLTKSCDVGRPAGELVDEFPTVDFRRMRPGARRSNDARRDANAIANANGVEGTAAVTDVDAGASSSGSEEDERWTDDRVWWYADPEADPPQRTAESCRRDFMTYGFVEPDRELRRRVAATLEHVRRRPERCVALVGHADFFLALARRMDPRGEELWLENCGVASYALKSDGGVQASAASA